jgi:CCR4-NOT transcription complex subunit 7/8
MSNEYGGGDLGPQYSHQEFKSGGPGDHSNKVSASGIFKTIDGKTIEIRDVWASNLDEEMEKIRDSLEKYHYIAMDTEFPGVVARPLGDVADMQYQTLRCNVDMLKLIQLGITLTDENGNFVENGCTCWQFNFKFSLS